VITYKLLTYVADDGPRAGLLVQDRVHDLARLTRRDADAAILCVLEDWPAAQTRLQTAARQASEGRAEGQPSAAVRLAAPVLHPSAIYCAGANYRDHSREMAAVSGREEGPDPRAAGMTSWHFLKPSRTVAADRAIVPRPTGCLALDWEVELAAVIGRPARKVRSEAALDHVAGYTVAIDLSARDLFRRAPTAQTSPFFHDWLGHKGFDGACPLGPWITPADQVGDPQSLELGLKVNGIVKQHSNTREMIFSIAEQIADLSAHRTLHPGDLVLTGTPAGVGAARKEFLDPGDHVEAWIEGLGSLNITIADSD
jgi:2-keto-4-pentenoate hydratase/2-oxohepta-3-ene-1,7-dioic acid hydratase in catechol pathway